MQRLPGVNPQHLLQGPGRGNIGRVMGRHKRKYHNVRLFNCAPRPKFSLQTDQGPSLLEMFVGIICACMPAAVHICHHYLPSYDSLKENLQIRYRSLALKHRSTDPSFPESTSHGIKTSRSVHEGYVNLERPELPMPVPVKSLWTKSLWTFAHPGSPGDFDHDGIPLTYEMQQKSTSPTTNTGRRTAV